MSDYSWLVHPHSKLGEKILEIKARDFRAVYPKKGWFFGTTLTPFKLFPEYQGLGKFEMEFLDQGNYRTKVKHFLLAKDVPTVRIEGVATMPLPPFLDQTEIGSDGVNAEYNEYWWSQEALVSEIPGLIRDWANALTETPKQISWVKHHWASFNGPAGDYGGSSPALVKAGSTLEEIQAWAKSL